MKKEFGKERSENSKISAKTEKPRAASFLKGDQVE